MDGLHDQPFVNGTSYSSTSDEYEYLSVPQHSQQQQTVNLLAKGRSRVQQQQTSISLLAN